MNPSATAHGAARAVWRRVAASPAAPLAWRARRLGRSGRRSFGGWLARAGSVIAGQGRIDGTERSATDPASARRLPPSYGVTPRPAPVGDDWPEPPEIADAGRIVRSLYETGAQPAAMDVALIEALNEEYRSKPLVPAPPTYDQTSRETRARRRLVGIHRQIDLAGKRVLELGCNAGFEVWYLSHHFDADAWGVDVVERAAWATLADERTHYVCTDIGVDSPFDADSFDRVISFTVLEHVVHPYAVLRDLFRIMRPGGLAWMSANLYRGPLASHLYRELLFPFPHLLFDDEVIAAWRQAHGKPAEGAAWVNRLTWEQYEAYFRRIGFRIRALRFRETPLDEAFYARFEGILGRYPKADLTKDFFDVVLEKPATVSGR